MSELVDKIATNIEQLEERFQNNPRFKEFESTSKLFNELVEKGLTSKRGNNLLSLSDIHTTRQVSFNAQ